MISEHIDSKEKGENFLKKAEGSETLKEMKKAFVETVSTPAVIKQTKLAQLKSIPSDQSYMDFAVYLKNIWESAYGKKVDLEDSQLINKFKECLPKSLRNKLNFQSQS